MSQALEALAAALRADVGADELELVYLGRRTGATRFSSSMVTQSALLEDPVIQVRASIGRRVGVARGANITRAAILELCKQAVSFARAMPERSTWNGFPDPRPPAAGPSGHAARTAECTPAERAGLLSEIFARSAKRGLECAGAFVTSETDFVVASTRGALLETKVTHAKLELIAANGDASGYATFYGSDVGRLDVARLTDAACEKALLMQAPREIEPGAYDVILEPAAVAESLEWIAMTAFGSKSIEEGSSFLAGRTNETVTGAGITWLDDALSGEGGVPVLAFDSEGVPKQRVTFVEAGTAKTACHDTLSAARMGVTSTGHAPLPSDEADGSSPTHLVMAAGNENYPQLLSQLDRGLVVTRFHYVNGLLDPRRALQTGMTRDGLFWVEGGQVRSGVKNLRWTEGMLEVFGRMEAATRERQAIGSSYALGTSVFAPTVLLRGFHFTGKSR